MAKPLTVIVVGAGYAGIGAARELLEEGGNDVQVTVLEGGQRVGGRACTVDGKEMGGTYFHGIYGHPLYEYAFKHGIVGAPFTKDFRWAFCEPGKAAPVDGDTPAQVRDAVQEYADVLLSTDTAAQGSTVGALLQQKYKQGGANSGSNDVRSKAWRWRELVTRIASGGESSGDISTAWWAGAEDLEGPNFPCSIGFQRLAEHMAAGVDVKFGAVVEKVQWGASGVNVRCADGRSFHADAAIVTVSIGVLKAMHAQLFEPALPEEKLQALKGLSIGTVDKIFLDFSSSGAEPGRDAHEDTVTAYHLLWSQPWQTEEEQAKPALVDAEQAVPDWAMGIFSLRFGGSEFKAPVASPANGHTDQAAEGTAAATCSGHETNGAKWPAFTGSGSSIYGNSSRETGRTAQGHCGSGLPSPWAEHPSAAVLWLTGEHAKAMEACGEDEVERGVAALLAAFPAIPCPADAQPKAVRSSWGSDPLFRGSYSYVNAGGSPGNIDTLAEPLTVSGRPVVCFAGEATHRQLTGTMGAAFLTGQREAARLLAAHKAAKSL